MATLVFICLLGVFSYHTTTINLEFRGSSQKAKDVYGLLGGIGYLLYFISLVWSFWTFAWWQPIVTLIASIAISGITAPIFQRTFIGVLVSPIALVVFQTLSIAWLILN